MSETEFKPEFSRDPTGFPMIWIDSIQGWLHWLPVTKVQFEVFLAGQDDRYFSAALYRKICRGNPRLDLQALTPENYWQAFVTGVLPREVEAFADWCGESYRVPTVGEWLEAFHDLAKIPAQQLDWKEPLAASPARRRQLATTLEEIFWQLVGRPRGAGTPSVVDQMFLRGGVVEWIRDANDPTSWLGLGEPHPSFAGRLLSLDLVDPVEPVEAETERIDYFGFRLIRSDSAIS